jgi:uncharacterized protein (DUF433 family)
MSATTIDIGTLIFHKPTAGGGRRACLKGSGISVKCIVNWHKMGLGPNEMLAKYSHLTLAEVYAALAYYHLNADEINAAIADDEAAWKAGTRSGDRS